MADTKLAKSKSKSQQRFFGMVHAVQKGEMKAPSKDVAEAAGSISKGDAEDFAETKHKGLPEKVSRQRMARCMAKAAYRGVLLDRASAPLQRHLLKIARDLQAGKSVLESVRQRFPKLSEADASKVAGFFLAQGLKQACSSARSRGKTMKVKRGYWVNGVHYSHKTHKPDRKKKKTKKADLTSGMGGAYGLLAGGASGAGMGGGLGYLLGSLSSDEKVRVLSTLLGGAAGAVPGAMLGQRAMGHLAQEPNESQGTDWTQRLGSAYGAGQGALSGGALGGMLGYGVGSAIPGQGKTMLPLILAAAGAGGGAIPGAMLGGRVGHNLGAPAKVSQFNAPSAQAPVTPPSAPSMSFAGPAPQAQSMLTKMAVGLGTSAGAGAGGWLSQYFNPKTQLPTHQVSPAVDPAAKSKSKLPASHQKPNIMQRDLSLWGTPQSPGHAAVRQQADIQQKLKDYTALQGKYESLKGDLARARQPSNPSLDPAEDPMGGFAGGGSPPKDIAPFDLPAAEAPAEGGEAGSPPTALAGFDMSKIKELMGNPYVQGGLATGGSLLGLYLLAKLMSRRKEEEDQRAVGGYPVMASPAQRGIFIQ